MLRRVRFELRRTKDRVKAFRQLRRIISDNLIRGRIPTFHVLCISHDGTATNHYMTPVSLEPIDDRGSILVNLFDFEFFLKLMLRLKNVKEVEYDPSRPAIIFTYVGGEGASKGGGVVPTVLP